MCRQPDQDPPRPDTKPADNAIPTPNTAAPLTDVESAKLDWNAHYEALWRDWNQLVERTRQAGEPLFYAQGYDGHHPAHRGVGGERGYPGRDTGAHDRGARKSPTGSHCAPVR